MLITDLDSFLQNKRWTFADLCVRVVISSFFESFSLFFKRTSLRTCYLAWFTVYFVHGPSMKIWNRTRRFLRFTWIFLEIRTMILGKAFDSSSSHSFSDCDRVNLLDLHLNCSHHSSMMMILRRISENLARNPLRFCSISDFGNF